MSFEVGGDRTLDLVEKSDLPESTKQIVRIAVAAAKGDPIAVARLLGFNTKMAVDWVGGQ